MLRLIVAVAAYPGFTFRCSLDPLLGHRTFSQQPSDAATFGQHERTGGNFGVIEAQC